jgi:cbb3-type cytochrome oxidase maturation protein
MDLTVYLVIAALLLGAGSWLAFIWAARSGQFSDVESITRKVLEVEREANAPERGGDQNE